MSARKLPACVDRTAAMNKTKLKHLTSPDVALDLPGVLEDDQLGGDVNAGRREMPTPANCKRTQAAQT